MYCSTSVTRQLLRGALALVFIVGAYRFSPQHMAALWLLAPAVLLMGGCPACWFSGLLRAIDRRSADDLAENAADTKQPAPPTLAGPAGNV